MRTARGAFWLLVLAGLAGACGDGDELPGHAPVIGVSFERITPRDRHGEPIDPKELTGMAFMPAEHGLLIWQKSGHIGHYRFEGGELVLQGELLIQGVKSEGDCGMTAVALDPEWETNHYLFATHCVRRNLSVLVRYEFDGEHYDIADSRELVLDAGDTRVTSSWHNMNGIGFFDDDEHSMWVLTGEKTLKVNAQDLTTNLGKVLRIIPRRGQGTSGYDPHPDNPFAGDPASSSGPDIYAWGLRNPFRGAIDPYDRLIVGEVGNVIEEINLVAEPGHNYGWPRADGLCDPDARDCSKLTDPVVHWTRDSGDRYCREDEHAVPTIERCSWLGTLYEPSASDPYEGFLDRGVLFSDMCVGFVRVLELDEEGRKVRDDHVGHLVGITGAAQGPDGYVYVTSFGSCSANKPSQRGGGIYRVLPRTARGAETYQPQVPEGPLVEQPLGPMPPRLSETGIFADDALTEPIERAVRYEPTLPLWSNGSVKERWLLLPEGERIDNRERDAWDFPPGTLFFKTFAYEGGEPERVETRIIRRTDGGYDYHVYKWDDDGRDATLLSLAQSFGVEVKLADGRAFRHHIPSRLDCRSCHESNDTVVIGFDELRLNGPRPGEAASQLDELAKAGLFEEPPPDEPDALERGDAQTRAVLGYLHGNCAHCHNGSSQTMSVLSLEHDVSFDNLVAVPTQGSGQAHGIRVVPGSPETSVLFMALSGEGDDVETKAMPPIGVDLIDRDAIELIRAWIEALAED